MNVYDFDKTIFKYDSSYYFVKYVMRKKPRIFLANSLKIASSCLSYLKNKDITPVKENIFSFLSYVSDLDTLVEDFWLSHEQYMQKWYLMQKRNDDVIISASPYFLIEPIAKKYGFKLIATDMDRYSGKILGVNNKGFQKVINFREEYGDIQIDEFYSDSLSDQPMADISFSAFIVNDDVILPWP